MLQLVTKENSDRLPSDVDKIPMLSLPMYRVDTESDSNQSSSGAETFVGNVFNICVMEAIAGASFAVIYCAVKAVQAFGVVNTGVALTAWALAGAANRVTAAGQICNRVRGAHRVDRYRSPTPPSPDYHP